MFEFAAHAINDIKTVKMHVDNSNLSKTKGWHLVK